MGEVKNCLQRKAENTFTDQRNGAHHFAIHFGAQGGGGRQRVIQRHAHPRGRRFHVALAHIGVVKQLETGLQFFFGFGNLQHQSLVGLGITFHK